MGEHEKFYDEEVAPVLAKLGKACEERGLGFVAKVQFGPEEYGMTATLPPNPTAVMWLTYLAAKCDGNIDLLVMHAARHAKKHGHNSVVLMRYCPPTPDDRGGKGAG